MPKFTQGEWGIATDGCIEIYSENGLMIKGIAEVAEFDTEEGKANARLIAAAPEMYELLKIYAENPFFNGTKARKLLVRIDGKEDHA